MPNTIHHQALHAAGQAVVASHPAWLDTLPPWVQEPVFLSFAGWFLLLALIMIRHRIKLHRQGKPFTRSKTKPAELIGGLLFGFALIYFQDKWPIIPLIFGWPSRTFPWYAEHRLEIWVGFIAGGIAARIVSALYAALFLRGGGGRYPGSAHGGFPPSIAPPEYITRVWNRTIRTTYEED